MDLNPGPHEINHGRHRRIHRALVVPTSVTRLGDFLDFGKLFKAFGNNLFAQISHIL